MKNKEYYLDIWTHWVWSYNNAYEDNLEHCPYLDETEETLDLLDSYCKIIVTEGKRRKKNHKKDNDCYDNYSASCQNAIQEIIRLLSDGREMHDILDVEYLGLPLKTFDHHLTKNGKLPFEDDPFYTAQRILDDIPAVREIVNSEKEKGNFEQFINKNWYYFEGYESGSVAVRFTKINVRSNGKFTFDGDMVSFETVNGRCDGDGVIFHPDVENISFEELPYWSDEVESTEDLIDWINTSTKEDGVLSFDELKKTAYKVIKYSLDDLDY